MTSDGPERPSTATNPAPDVSQGATDGDGALSAADLRAELDATRAELHALHATDDYQRWARAVAERDAAREQVGRVRGVCDEAERLGGGSASDYDKGAQRLAQRIVAALDGGAAT